MANVIFLSVKNDVPATGYWDHTFLTELFDGIGESDRTVVVIPGAYQWDVIPEINARLAQFPKVLVIVTSDEEHKFDERKLEHPHMILYSQYGNGGWPFPLGYGPRTREALKELGLQEKVWDWAFMGQVTHYRRQKLMEAVADVPNGMAIPTDGFAKGLKHPEYLRRTALSKTVLCPPGPISVDSFRLYEALEAGAVPIADDISPLKSGSDKYWRRLFRFVPFPVYSEFTDAKALISKVADSLPLQNQVFAWWIKWKYQFRDQLKEDLGIAGDDMAVIVPISPIPSHPDTHILEETIQTIRTHTNAPILLCFDGVREEQQSLAAQYQEFTRKMLWKCNFEYEGVLPLIFSEHFHQSGMMKFVLEGIKTPFIMYVEHDTPLTPDWPIELDKIKAFIASGESNLVRLHFESVIPDPHKYLMVGEPENGFLKTKQWSQRPHIASTEYYRKIMDEFFTPESRTFIEDRMHGIVQGNDWEANKLHIYHPEGSIKRSYHLDGRQGAEKYDDKLIY